MFHRFTIVLAPAFLEVGDGGADEIASPPQGMVEKRSLHAADGPAGDTAAEASSAERALARLGE